MKPIALLALTALNLIAQDPNARLACLVGPDATMIYGIDVERYQNSQLAQAYPIVTDFWPIPTLRVKKITATLSDTWGNPFPALILQGSAFSAQALVSQPGHENDLRTYRGFPAVALAEDTLLVLLETNLAVTGNTDSVSRIIDRVTATDCTGELAAKIGELSGSYDAWFAALRPLEHLDLMPRSERRLELAQSIEEVHGGMQLGSVNSFKVEITTKDPSDAAAAAALARWLPAMLEKDDSVEANLVRVIENFATQSTGRTASMSFLLPDTAVETALKVKGNRKVDFEVVQ